MKHKKFNFEVISGLFFAFSLSIFEVFLLDLIFFGKDFTYDYMDITLGLVLILALFNGVTTLFFVYSDSEKFKKFFNSGLKTKLLTILIIPTVALLYFGLPFVLFRVKMFWMILVGVISALIGYLIRKLN